MSYLDDMVKALRGGINPMDEVASMPRENAIASGVANMATDLVTLPKRAIENSQFALDTGNYDPAVPMEAAMSLATGGMPMAEKGAAGIFGGKLAAGADHKAMQEAQRMWAGGKDMEGIIKDTKWFLDPTDQKWKWEIPDNRSVMKYMPEREGNIATGSLESLFHHPEAYKNYPELRGNELSLTKFAGPKDFKGAGGFDIFTDKMFVNAPDWRTARDVTLHEMQHAIQKKEGFSYGANPRYYAQRIEEDLRKQPDFSGVYDFNKVKKAAEDLYYKTAGEVEARNVQKRKDFSPFERVNYPPWASQEVKYNDQIVFDPVTETIRALKR